MAALEFEDLIKNIKPSASTENVAAATIALRLYHAQISGPTGGTVGEFFRADANGDSAFKTAVTDIKARVSAL